MLKYEAEGLARMHAAAPSLRVPLPWLSGETESTGEGFLVMEHVELGGRAGSGHREKLGMGLAEMHLAPVRC